MGHKWLTLGHQAAGMDFKWGNMNGRFDVILVDVKTWMSDRDTGLNPNFAIYKPCDIK